jgi:hypothetical protein
MYLDPDSKAKWRWLLQDAAWVLNTSYHTALGMTPYEAMFGDPPPIDALGIPVKENHFDKFPVYYGMRRKQLMDKRQQLQHSLAKARNTSLQHRNAHAHRIPYKIGDYVLYKNNRAKKWDEKYFGPWKIISQISPVVYELNINNERFTAHAAYLKPYKGQVPEDGNDPQSEYESEEEDPGESPAPRFVQNQFLYDPEGPTDSMGLANLFASPASQRVVQTPDPPTNNGDTPAANPVRQAIKDMRRMINFRRPTRNRSQTAPNTQPYVLLHRLPDNAVPDTPNTPATVAAPVSDRPRRERRPVQRYGDFEYNS